MSLIERNLLGDQGIAELGYNLIFVPNLQILNLSNKYIVYIYIYIIGCTKITDIGLHSLTQNFKYIPNLKLLNLRILFLLCK